MKLVHIIIGYVLIIAGLFACFISHPFLRDVVIHMLLFVYLIYLGFILGDELLLTLSKSSEIENIEEFFIILLDDELCLMSAENEDEKIENTEEE